MKKILYLHGRGSKPGGTKPIFMKTLGYEVVNPQLPDESFHESVLIAKDYIQKHNPDFVVGSSRGGAVALKAVGGDENLILICPAWKHFDVKPPASLENVTILHSVLDDVIPFDDSKMLLKEHKAMLIACGENHRMIDEEALSVLADVLSRSGGYH